MVQEFYYRRIFAVKQCKLLRDSQTKNLIFFEFSRVSPGAHPTTKKPGDSGYEIAFRVACAPYYESEAKCKAFHMKITS